MYFLTYDSHKKIFHTSDVQEERKLFPGQLVEKDKGGRIQISKQIAKELKQTNKKKKFL